MKKIITVSVFLIALVMPLAISTGAFANSTSLKQSKKTDLIPAVLDTVERAVDTVTGNNEDDKRDDAVKHESKANSIESESSSNVEDETNNPLEEPVETITTIVEDIVDPDETTTTTTNPDSNDENTPSPTPGVVNNGQNSCVSASWNDNGKTFMDMPEKEFSFQSTCTTNGNTNTTVLAYFFYGYDYKTIEKYRETHTTIILGSPFSNASAAPTSAPLVPFPQHSNEIMPPASGTQEVAMGDVEAPQDNSNTFSMPIILTSIGSIIIYGVKKRLLLPF